MGVRRFCIDGFMRILALLVLSILLTAVYSCSDSESPVEVGNCVHSDPVLGEGMKNAPTQTWTFLLYSAADAGPYTGSPLQSFAEQFCTGNNVQALCLEDTYGETAKIWYIGEDHNTVLLEDLGEINMGSVTTLSDFLEYAKSNYPADRYIVSFYGHGGAWGGACTDLDPSFDVLRMDDMKRALTGAGGVDLVLFSAPCLMGTFEGAYELRGCTDVYVGSEGLSNYRFWYTVMGSLSTELNSNPNIKNHELGRMIIEWMAEDKSSYNLYGNMQYLTMCAVRTDRLRRLGDALDELAIGYMSDPVRFRALVDSIREEVIYFDKVWVTDLNSLLLNLCQVETDAGMRAMLEETMICLSDAVIAEIHLSKYSKIQGLSIFLPDETTTGVMPAYVDDEYGLDFVLDAHWDELLFSIFPPAETGSGANDISSDLRRLQAGPE